MRRPILVLGATGEVGGRVAKGLAERGWPVVGATRAPAGAGRKAERALGMAGSGSEAGRKRDRAAGMAGSGPGAGRKADRASDMLGSGPAAQTPVAVRWVALDLERPETFAPALAGVERVFLLARPGDDQPEAVAAPLIQAMREAGVARVVDLSAMGVEREPEFGLRRVERLLETSGLAWTHLRPNFFMQIFASPPLLPVIRATGTIRMPAADARLSYVDTRDIASVAVRALTEAGHAGKAYTLTGPEALAHEEVARTLTAAAGAAIGYRPLSEEEARAELGAAGLGPERVERLIGFYRRVRTGAWAAVSGDVPEVLGRPARSFAAFASEYGACWRGAGGAGAEAGAGRTGARAGAALPRA